MNNFEISKTLIFTILLFLFISCCTEKSALSPSENDGFTICIVDTNSNPCTTTLDKIAVLRHPFLTTSDIISYKWSNHQITYHDSIYKKLKTWGNLLHRYFIITAGKERIYWGMFMDDLDSGSCQNPVIKLLPRHPDGNNTIPPSIRIERAYPEYFGTDPDLRTDSRIYKALEEANVLIF